MPVNSLSGFPGGGDPNTYEKSIDGSGVIAAAAIAISNTAAGQASAWSVVGKWHRNTMDYAYDPRYAIIPR